MYAGFIEWAGAFSQYSTLDSETPREIIDAREAALDFFDKRSELNERKAVYKQKETLINSFSGPNVRDWTDLGNYWLGVKKIMDGVRDRLGGDDNIGKLISEEGEERLKCIVLEVQVELGVWPRSKTATSGEVAAGEEEHGLVSDKALVEAAEKLKMKE